MVPCQHKLVQKARQCTMLNCSAVLLKVLLVMQQRRCMACPFPAARAPRPPLLVHPLHLVPPTLCMVCRLAGSGTPGGIWSSQRMNRRPEAPPSAAHAPPAAPRAAGGPWPARWRTTPASGLQDSIGKGIVESQRSWIAHGKCNIPPFR